MLTMEPKIACSPCIRRDPQHAWDCSLLAQMQLVQLGDPAANDQQSFSRSCRMASLSHVVQAVSAHKIKLLSAESCVLPAVEMDVLFLRLCPCLVAGVLHHACPHCCCRVPLLPIQASAVLHHRCQGKRLLIQMPKRLHTSVFCAVTEPSSDLLPVCSR